MKTKNKEKLPAGFLIPAIILSILAVILALFLVSLLLDGHRSGMYDEDLFYYNLEKKHYNDTYHYYLRNSALGGSDEKFSELYGAANYWHDSLMYYGLQGSDRTEKYENAMQKDREKAGSLDFLLNDMDQLFEEYRKPQ